MKSKVTIRDIAREANVSVATVSYVMNGRTDQKISENTRKKIIQIANVLGYESNMFAKSLVTGKSNRIALYLGETDFSLKSAYYLKFINCLSTKLETNGYSLLLIPSHNVGRIYNVDSIICLNTSYEIFSTIGDNNFVPLIAVDSIVNDPIFYQINFDFSKIALEQYDVAISFFYNDRRLLDVIRNSGKVFIVDSFAEIQNVLNSNKGKKILCLGSTLYEYCSTFNQDVTYYKLNHEALIDKLIEAIKYALDRNESIDHNIVI